MIKKTYSIQEGGLLGSLIPRIMNKHTMYEISFTSIEPFRLPNLSSTTHWN